MVKACKKLPKSIYNNLKYGIIKIGNRESTRVVCLV